MYHWLKSSLIIIIIIIKSFPLVTIFYWSSNLNISRHHHRLAMDWLKVIVIHDVFITVFRAGFENLDANQFFNKVCISTNQSCTEELLITSNFFLFIFLHDSVCATIKVFYMCNSGGGFPWVFIFKMVQIRHISFTEMIKSIKC